MKSLLMLGAIVAATAVFAAPESAQANDYCYGGGYGRVGYRSAYSYAPRSHSFGYSTPRYYGGSHYGRSHYGRSHYGGSHYGHGRSHGYFGGHSYGHGYGGFGIHTRRFSFSYHR